MVDPTVLLYYDELDMVQLDLRSHDGTVKHHRQTCVQARETLWYSPSAVCGVRAGVLVDSVVTKCHKYRISVKSCKFPCETYYGKKRTFWSTMRWDYNDPG